MKSTQPQKTIFAIRNRSNTGKTETLRELALLLLHSYPQHKVVFSSPPQVPQRGDFRLIIRINGKVIAVESQGDPNTGIASRLTDIALNQKADIIFCSTRTKGDTILAVCNISQRFDYQIVWTSTYETKNGLSHANNIKAKHMLDFLKNSSFI